MNSKENNRFLKRKRIKNFIMWSNNFDSDQSSQSPTSPENDTLPADFLSGSLNDSKSNILMMGTYLIATNPSGLRRSGKSSIQQVVFNKMNANETLYLKSTKHLGRLDLNSFLPFHIWYPQFVLNRQGRARNDGYFRKPGRRTGSTIPLRRACVYD
jgi:hypothetical protein